MNMHLISLFSILFVFLPLMVGVSAQNNGDIRLSGTNSNSSQGRVEVFYNGVWGTVCNDEFGDAEAIVVCRQLGAPNPSKAIAVLNGTFGPGIGDILMDDLNCQATEIRLADCSFGGWNVSNCQHDEDAGVICPTSAGTPQTTLRPPPTQAPVIPDTGNCTVPDENIRLIGPSNLDGVGVVQIRRNGVWGGVCDNNWDLLDARVVCRMLCFDPEKALPGGVAFDTSNITEPMIVNNTACTGNEASITDCSLSEGSCGRSEMAKVTCVDLDNAPPKRPEPLLDCSNGLLSGSFARSRDPNLEVSVTLNYTGPCNAVQKKDADYVTIQIPFDECGTQRTSNGTHIIYKTVIKYIPTSGGVSTSNTYMVHVQCELPREVLADKPIVPLTEITEIVTQSAPGEFVVNMHFYRNNSFKVPVTDFPLQIPLGEWLNSALELTEVDRNLRLVVPNCYATPSNDKNDPIKYPLFTDKCTNDQTVGFFPLNNTWFGYRYQTFKFVQYNEVYIHCDAYICEHDDTTPQCDRSCFPSTTSTTTTSGTTPGSAGRRRRSIGQPRHVYVSSGTLIVYDPNPSNEIVRPVHSTSTKRPNTESSTKRTTAPVITRQSSISSKTTFLSHSVTQTTAHVTNRQPENALVEEIFVIENGSRSIFKPCFVILFISFMFNFIRL